MRDRNVGFDRVVADLRAQLTGRRACSNCSLSFASPASRVLPENRATLSAPGPRAIRRARARLWRAASAAAAMAAAAAAGPPPPQAVTEYEVLVLVVNHLESAGLTRSAGVLKK